MIGRDRQGRDSWRLEMMLSFALGVPVLPVLFRSAWWGGLWLFSVALYWLLLKLFGRGHVIEMFLVALVITMLGSAVGMHLYRIGAGF